ncbi:hypothetical protein HanPSC8_Chr06g0243691 [Helianthus annuus]|nr:hypothetical protein HanPSC8_Chr06g0243691 [Helianthus annuus]
MASRIPIGTPVELKHHGIAKTSLCLKSYPLLFVIPLDTLSLQIAFICFVIFIYFVVLYAINSYFTVGCHGLMIGLYVTSHKKNMV